MCSYCGCSDLEVIGRFRAEHEHIVNHLGELRRSLDDEPRRHAAVEQLAAHLDPHVAAEESGLFTVMARDELFTDHIGGLCDEHDELDDLLGRIGQGRVELFPLFESLLREHIDREDNGLFPAAAIHLGGPEWAEVDTLTRTRGGVSGGNCIGS
ncbi:MAG: hemerythrin domain-containing protein [Dermatophilaceae bacterium]|nr:hemerythrin domain-containing protein [Dermatophilaceae bacterium]